MIVVSDLTRDIRPSLTELFVKSIRQVLEDDKNRSEVDGDIIQYENDTFYYRVIVHFMRTSLLYYTDAEVKEWSSKELLN